MVLGMVLGIERCKSLEFGIWIALLGLGNWKRGRFRIVSFLTWLEWFKSDCNINPMCFLPLDIELIVCTSKLCLIFCVGQ
jgi:hypothetical protein